jgi:hypothetical protein
MSHVINSNERNHAFLKFMFFFIITVVLILSAAYVNFEALPETRLNLLEQKLAVQRAEGQAQQQFVTQMEAARNLLDSLDKGGKNQTQIDLSLVGKLTNMENLRQRDSSLNGKYNAVILDSFLELQRLKKEMDKMRELALKARDMEARLNECEATLDNWRSRPQPMIEQ